MECETTMLTSLIFALPFGFLCGLRSLTPPMCLAWAAYLGVAQVSFADTVVNDIALDWSIIAPILTVLAIAELIGDKLSFTPNRTALPLLAGRLLSGGICGIFLAAQSPQEILSQKVPALLIVVIAIVGALAGTIIGFKLRIAAGLRWPSKKFVIALTEDAITLGSAMLLTLLL